MKTNIDGETGEQWLRHQFECEYCAECGGDACHHTAVPFFGNWFARCDYPSDETDGAWHPVIKEARCIVRLKNRD